MRRHIQVVGAVIVRDGLVLCTQRGSGALAGKWEFPGGKIEDGEAARDALQREVREELLCEVAVGDEVVTTTHEDDGRTVTLTTFYCALLSEGPRLTEHADARWLPGDRLDELEWAPADVPAVMKVQARLAQVEGTPESPEPSR